jgi:Ca-activated chloride channel family protein
MIFNSKWFDNSRIDGFPVLEIAVKSDNEFMFVPLVRTHIDGRIYGPLSDFTISQTFRYSREINPHVIEAFYRFPLPGDAAVTSVDVSFGQVTIHSMLKSRKVAETEYKNAKKENQAAVFLTRESLDVFTLRIAGIAPDEDVIIKTRYVQIGQPKGTAFSFRIPLTTAPRYIRNDERYSRHANGQPLAILQDPSHRFSLSVSIGGKGTITSPTHAITGTPGEIVTLDEGEVIPDRDCVLTWEPVHGDANPACQIFSDEQDETHFLALVSPPQQTPVHYPRDVIILVDHSGSMEGAKWEAADWAVERFITGLTGQDTFNLCLFESRTYWLSDQPLIANEGNKVRAIRFFEDKRSGGTELGVALEQAVSQVRRKGALSRNVIIITDAEVTDSGRILRIVDKESQHKEARRFSILCIDAAPNANLAQQLAERGGGVAKFLSSSPKEEDITSALDEILHSWDTPVAVGLTLRVNRENLLVDRHKVTQSPDSMCHVDLGDLPSGKSTWVAVRAPPGQEPIRYELCMPDNCTFPVTVVSCPAVSVLFGARLVAELECLMHAGYEEKELSRHLSGLGYEYDSLKLKHPVKVYAENQMRDTMSLMRDLVGQESLKYQVLSAETAFVTVRSEPGRTVEEQVIVPNALPHEWSESFLQTGAGYRHYSMKKGFASGPARSSSLGVPLEWVGEGSDIIMQPDGTMKMECRRSPGNSGSADHFRGVTAVRSTSSNQNALQGSGTQAGYTLYLGSPEFTDGVAVLFDSTCPEQVTRIPETVLLKRLKVAFKGKTPVTATTIELLIYLGDIVAPLVRIRIRDLMDHNGIRPLNIQRINAELFRIVLVNPDDKWRKNSPELEVTVW